TFPVTTFGVATQKVVTITETYQGSYFTANLTVQVPSVSSHYVLPLRVVGGNAATGTVTLTGIAPAGGAVITLASSNTSAATVPASVTIPAGQTSATYPVTTAVVSTMASSTITATYAGGLPYPAYVTLLPVPPPLSAISISPTATVGGTLATGTVTLSAAAATGGVDVAVTSSDPVTATQPNFVTIPAGATTTTFGISTKGVTSSTTVTFTAN